MRIYVAGPYGDHNPEAVIAANVMVADEAGRALLKMGHTPFIPHKMTWGWEKDADISRDDYLRMDIEWLSLCDGIFMLPKWAESVGAKQERDYAAGNGLKIFYHLDQVPSEV